MKILFLTHSFNSLAQKLYAELTRSGHTISIEFDINDKVSIEAAEMFKPNIIIAPFLKRAIPKIIWEKYICLIVHPGIRGDRGPSALDWAILKGEKEWGVTILQANAEMDAGPIWAYRNFPLRCASKSSIYRNELAEAATDAIKDALEKFQAGNFIPTPLNYDDPVVTGQNNPAMKQTDRTINWACDNTDQIIRKIHSGDGTPGALAPILGREYYLYNVTTEPAITGTPGEIIGQRNGAICIATIDRAIWVTHLKQYSSHEKKFKLAAGLVLAELLANIPTIYSSQTNTKQQINEEIYYEECDQVGYLHFNFYNGAMSTRQCLNLLAAYKEIKKKDTRVIVLMGGKDFWSNGIDLNMIEASENPAEESLKNIDAINDIVREIILTDTKLTVSALQGAAAAGGVFLALACDYVWARNGIILNPHYKNIGNLYGSEYWTYLLPKRIGLKLAKERMESRQPILSEAAVSLGIIDDASGTIDTFKETVRTKASALAASSNWNNLLQTKASNRLQDENTKPLEQYRAEEMEKMKLNFFGFDPSYHVARYNFVHKIPKSRTPLHLAIHRNKRQITID